MSSVKKNGILTET